MSAVSVRQTGSEWVCKPISFAHTRLIPLTDMCTHAVPQTHTQSGHFCLHQRCTDGGAVRIKGRWVDTVKKGRQEK